jgi:hypothetical protein
MQAPLSLRSIGGSEAPDPPARSRFGARAAPRVRPSTARSLPAWFEANRVQGHTRLHIHPWLTEREFAEGRRRLQGVGRARVRAARQIG